jgi:DnaJ-class molecular chaperone
LFATLQEISEAYEAISTSENRAQYAFDARTGSKSSSARSGGGGFGDDDMTPNAPHVDPEELFRTVAEDLGVGGEIVKNYLYDLQEDMAEVSAAVK